MQSAFPTRSQKSSGALPARLTDIVRGHPAGAMVRGSEACPSHFSRSDFRTIAEGACRVSATSAQILSPAHNGVFKGVPPLTRFCSLLACTKSESSCGGETPPGMRPGAVPRQAHGSAQPLCPKLAGQVQTKAPRPKPGQLRYSAQNTVPVAAQPSANPAAK